MKHFLPCGKTGAVTPGFGQGMEISQTASMDAFCTLREAKRFRKASMAWVRASIPVSAVIEDGRLIVRRGSRTAVSGIRQRSLTAYLYGFPSIQSVMTAAAVASEPVPGWSSARQTAAEVSDGLSRRPASQEPSFRTADAGTDQLCCIENGSAADGEDSLRLNLLIKTETLFHALNLRIRGDFGENGDGNVFFLQPSSRDVSVPRRTKPGVVTRRIREIRRFRNNAGSSRTASGAARSVCFLCSVR